MCSVLVTGGCGYIGSHMAYELVSQEMDVVVLDNLSTGFPEALPAAVPLVVGDVGDVKLVAEVIERYDVKAIIHFAGSIVVPESVRDPMKYYRNNTLNSQSLVATAISAGVRKFVFSSTAAVYGMPDRCPVTEETVCRPLNPYGWSKLMTEVMLSDAAKAHDFRYVALRYFNVAGADPQGRTGLRTAGATHLIKVACEAALGKRSHVEVFGTDYPTSDGTGVRDYIHVSDLVRAHLHAIDYLARGGQSIILNCGYARGFSVREVIETVKRVSGQDFAVHFGPRRPGDAAAVIADSTALRPIMGWQPVNDDLVRIVGDALAWERRLPVTERLAS
jgi:UDP-glucose 4-epimerase